MIVYPVFRIDCDDVFLEHIFATEELAKDYCTLMHKTQEADWYTWDWRFEEVVTEPFWPKILPNQIDFRKEEK